MADKNYVSSFDSHVSLGTALRGALFFVPVAVAVVVALNIYGWTALPYSVVGGGVVFALVWGILVNGIRIAAQWERGVILFNGVFRRIQQPGIFFVIPFLETILYIDQRLLTINIPSQQVITKDNVPAAVESVLFYRVTDPRLAVVSVQNFRFAIAQYAQATLRDVIGNLSLDELLSERESIQEQIAENVAEYIKEWGLTLDTIRLQDIELPEDLKRIMSRQATAEREKRATITKAEGDKIAADNLSKAAAIMQQTTGAMQLRTLQTIDGLGTSNCNTVILFPVEIKDDLGKIAMALAKGKE